MSVPAEVPFSELLAKYDRPVPRYTSYPTVPNWTGIHADEWREAVERCLSDFGAETSLYVHVPYCQSLCAFCACTRVISRDRSGLAAPYVDAVLRELDLKLPRPAILLRDLHLGGGTPNWLPPAELKRLIEGLRSRFRSEGAEISIEIDPRSFAPEHARVLGEGGVRRVSLGVQDFHEPTLRAIKRFQSLGQVESVMSELRRAGIQSFNFDFVYGLPYQSVESMRATGEVLARLHPSRVAVYSYAHLPSLKPAQKGVESHGLPEGEAKWLLYTTLRERLKREGYAEIGMDHFALPSDDLALAKRRGSLHRNFMGYTVRRSSLLLGLGPSSLSDAWYAFAQNPKDTAEWIKSVHDASIVAPRGGHRLSAEDLRRRKLILELMCHSQSPLSDDDWRSVADSDVVTDGLLVRNSATGVSYVTERGRAFLRNICALFDEKVGQASGTRMSRAV